jgi:very-short-patch-repair endonuclease
MPPDWSQVTLEHVQRACELHDSGAALPQRPARSTFLLLKGRTYPAKFIRGLAYRIATGIELDPARDYAGGLATVRFFERLGLATQRDCPAASVQERMSAPEAPRFPPLPPPSDKQGAPYVASGQNLLAARPKEAQKAALAKLLCEYFGVVVTEAKFPWLTVPHPEEMDENIHAIFRALQGIRGYLTFASFGKSLCCDFFLPSQGLIIEYDERQHFTLQRAKALELYPPNLVLGFDREEWLSACRTLQATDPTPPYRDEQRAFYDSLRDILAARNGIRLIRLRHGAVDWTRPEGYEQIAKLFTRQEGCEVREFALPSIPEAPQESADQIRKLALISHDYYVPNSTDHFDYSEDFADQSRLRYRGVRHDRLRFVHVEKGVYDRSKP